MKATGNTREILAEARQLEQSGQLTEAAALYQQVVDQDSNNRDAVSRLLVVYRKQKEYKKELAVIKAALAAFDQRDKVLQQKWLQAHPKAAGAGKAILRKLGGTSASGSDPVVNGLLKRKIFVEKRLATKPAKKNAIIRRLPAKTKGPSRKEKSLAAATKKAEKAEKAKKAEKAAALAIKRQQERDRKAAAAAARKLAQEQRQQQAEAQKQAKQLAAQQAKANSHPSLFVVTLRYLAPLEDIDAAMPRHMKFLEKHYADGNFLVSGRQVPRTGGIIIARGKDRTSVERMMRQDPFIKGKLATLDIVEFSASQIGKGIEKWVKG